MKLELDESMVMRKRNSFLFKNFKFFATERNYGRVIDINHLYWKRARILNGVRKVSKGDCYLEFTACVLLLCTMYNVFIM